MDRCRRWSWICCLVCSLCVVRSCPLTAFSFFVFFVHHIHTRGGSGSACGATVGGGRWRQQSTPERRLLGDCCA